MLPTEALLDWVGTAGVEYSRERARRAAIRLAPNIAHFDAWLVVVSTFRRARRRNTCRALCRRGRPTAIPYVHASIGTAAQYRRGGTRAIGAFEIYGHCSRRAYTTSRTVIVPISSSCRTTPTMAAQPLRTAFSVRTMQKSSPCLRTSVPHGRGGIGQPV